MALPAAELRKRNLALLRRRRVSGAMTEDCASNESCQRNTKHIVTHDFLFPV
jgi:hypothetical protein